MSRSSNAVHDQGEGAPIVLVPSLQGRWEYLSPAIDALAQSHRVITFSLSDDGRALGPLAEQISRALDDRGLPSATICGVSFGGRVALRFAARHPERTDALVLVSVPGPGWHLKRLHRWMARFPLLAAPFFFPAVPVRLRMEVVAAIPSGPARRAFALRQFRTFLQAPVSPSRMAARALLIDGADIADDCAAIALPTLVVTGEPALDHVVPVDGSNGFARAIRDARAATLEGTGHLGCITRPDAFAAIVGAFLATTSASASTSGDRCLSPG